MIFLLEILLSLLLLIPSTFPLLSFPSSHSLALLLEYKKMGDYLAVWEMEGRLCRYLRGEDLNVPPGYSLSIDRPGEGDLVVEYPFYCGGSMHVAYLAKT